MSHQCLICKSTALLNQDTARAIIQLLATVNGFVRGLQAPYPLFITTHHEEPVAVLLES